MTAAPGGLELRADAAAGLGRDSRRIAEACRDMADRFMSGGRILVFATGPAAADAEHVAVEFVHPVIVGKRAIPAAALAGDVAGPPRPDGAVRTDDVFVRQLRLLASPPDVALGISRDGRDRAVLLGIEEAKRAGLLTVALSGGDGGPLAASPAVDHCIVVASDDPLVVKEVQVTAYHLLWELVHVFLERSPEAPS